jgi:ABC-type uncharacterized transport system ATPase subunit
VTVSYGGLRALSDVSLAVAPGQIHALLGENGAGKSTLGNVLAGRLAPDAGEVEIPRPVGHVHQHFAIPPGLSSAECLQIGRRGARYLGRRALDRHFRDAAALSGLDLGDPGAEAASLSVGARQRLEFAREVARHPRLLVLDEPTAVLAPAEVERFCAAVREVARKGTAVLFITHKLPEVFRLADRVSLLRRGSLVFERTVGETTPEEVAAEFLRGEAPPRKASPRPQAAAAVIEIDLLTVRGRRGETAVSRLSLAVARGEIAAVVGVDGNGQAELTRAVLGLDRPESGSIRVQGSRIGAAGFRRLGGAVVPGDRQREGLVLDFTVEENLRLAEPIRRVGDAEARRWMGLYDIRAASPRQKARELSGGNQQKVVLARELSRDPAILLAVSPTRGLDLAASASTLSALREAAARGAAVLLVSSDLDEARAAAHSLYVIYRGRLSERFEPDAPDEILGRRMTGLP